MKPIFFSQTETLSCMSPLWKSKCYMCKYGQAITYPFLVGYIANYAKCKQSGCLVVGISEP